jgi:hypothetical protein
MRILVVVAVLAFAPITMAVQNQPSAAHKRQNAGQANPPAPVCVNYNCATQTDDSQKEAQGWHKFVAWPEGITVWAIFGTLAAIVWQTIATSRAATASEKALIASLRPKLVVKRLSLIPGKIEDVDGIPTLKDDPEWRIGCVIANIGGSRASITESDLTIMRLG